MLEGAALLALAPWPCAPATSPSRDKLTLSRSDELMIQLKTHPAKEKTKKKKKVFRLTLLQVTQREREHVLSTGPPLCLPALGGFKHVMTLKATEKMRND